MRHGSQITSGERSDDNRYDPPLSARGHAEALASASELAAELATARRRGSRDPSTFRVHLFSSPMRRALQTALSVSDALGGIPIHCHGGYYEYRAATARAPPPGRTSQGIAADPEYPRVQCDDAMLFGPDGAWDTRHWRGDKETEDEMRCRAKDVQAWLEDRVLPGALATADPGPSREAREAAVAGGSGGGGGAVAATAEEADVEGETPTVVIILVGHQTFTDLLAQTLINDDGDTSDFAYGAPRFKLRRAAHLSIEVDMWANERERGGLGKRGGGGGDAEGAVQEKAEGNVEGKVGGTAEARAAAATGMDKHDRREGPLRYSYAYSVT